MESQPQNPEFRNNPENFHPCYLPRHICLNIYSNQYTVDMNLILLVQLKENLSHVFSHFIGFLLLLIYCCSHCLWGFCVWYLFCYSVLCVLLVLQSS